MPRIRLADRSGHTLPPTLQQYFAGRQHAHCAAPVVIHEEARFFPSMYVRVGLPVKLVEALRGCMSGGAPPQGPMIAGAIEGTPSINHQDGLRAAARPTDARRRRLCCRKALCCPASSGAGHMILPLRSRGRRTLPFEPKFRTLCPTNRRLSTRAVSPGMAAAARE